MSIQVIWKNSKKRKTLSDMKLLSALTNFKQRNSKALTSLNTALVSITTQTHWWCATWSERVFRDGLGARIRKIKTGLPWEAVGSNTASSLHLYKHPLYSLTAPSTLFHLLLRHQTTAEVRNDISNTNMSVFTSHHTMHNVYETHPATVTRMHISLLGISCGNSMFVIWGYDNY